VGDLGRARAGDAAMAGCAAAGAVSGTANIWRVGYEPTVSDSLPVAPSLLERKGDQQPAQPGARHLGEDAVVRANLKGSKHPDVHLADFAMGHWQASNC
jgi:hypothetical protein